VQSTGARSSEKNERNDDTLKNKIETIDDHKEWN